MRRLAPLVLFVAACAPGSQPTDPTPGPIGTVTTTTTTTIPARGGPIPVCATEEPAFALDGNIGTAGAAGSDAATLTEIRWFSTEECDRLELRFIAASGAPALDPPVVAGVMLRRFGVIRVSLGPTVSDTAVLDRLIEADFVRAAYVVRDTNGSIFVDLHLARPAEARLTSIAAPATVIIDVRPGGDDYPSRPLVAGRVVLIDPTGGSVTGPLIVAGYQRSPEPIMPSLTAADGSQRQVASEGGVFDGSSWVSFAFVFADPLVGEAVLAIDEIMVPVTVTG